MSPQSQAFAYLVPSGGAVVVGLGGVALLECTPQGMGHENLVCYFVVEVKNVRPRSLPQVFTPLLWALTLKSCKPKYSLFHKCPDHHILP